MFFRVAACGLLPARWFEGGLPQRSQRTAKNGRLHLEIVSHCWKYSHLLIYQLSSLVKFPPENIDITMTVFYSPEDHATQKLLAFFSQQNIAGIEWNWMTLPTQSLYRRGIGRNLAALKTKADWVWFTDCDLMFRQECLDTLAQRLQGRQDALVFPDQERTSELLSEDNPLLKTAGVATQILDIDSESFTVKHPQKATGPLQIAHGDVCRAVGYCRNLKIYQQPSEHWCKAHEDRAFRWLLQTEGIPVSVPGVYRIRHREKGRYTGSRTSNYWRKNLRVLQDRLRHPVRKKS